MQQQRVSNLRLFGYALGEGALSITMNGISNFAMLFYTMILGLGAGAAGMALGITVLWDAITDPVMGHITDNTRSRKGKRHPYLIIGGAALAITFLSLWLLPGPITDAKLMFWAVLILNLGVRTAVTVFAVPYTALGFEICPDYVDRSRLQGIRYFLNQVVNFVFGALAWSLFFRDGTAEDGSRIDGTAIASNYLVMGVVLAIFTFVLILGCVRSTRIFAVDNRDEPVAGQSFGVFIAEMKGILSDRLALNVFAYFAVAMLGMLLVSQLQMFVYVFYMEFTSTEKTIVHGGGMLSFAVGSLCLPILVRAFDKKGAGYFGIGCTLVGSALLLIVFSLGLVQPGATFAFGGINIPFATGLFALGQALWWGGCGILVPLAMSMIADISGIDAHRSGRKKDGSYAAVFSFVLKAATSLGLLVTGQVVEGLGIVSGAEVQDPTAVSRVALATFVIGPVLTLTAAFLLRIYPVDKAYIEALGMEPDIPIVPFGGDKKS